MVVSEIAAATLIAVCGLKRSYRIVLKGERLVRRTIKRPSPIVEGYDNFPRFFIRRVFRAGQGIAMKWEGRAQNAAQRARDARLRAIQAGSQVRDRAAKARERAGEVRVVAQERASKAAGRASEAGAKMRARVTDEYRRRQAARDPGAEEGRGRGFRTLARPEGDFRERAKGVSTRFRE